MRQAILRRDPESDGWIAEVPSLPGCVSEGDTKEEALANIAQAAAAWVEAARELGWDVPVNTEIELRAIAT